VLYFSSRFRNRVERQFIEQDRKTSVPWTSHADYSSRAHCEDFAVPHSNCSEAKTLTLIASRTIASSLFG
jgi:hypothetical protein